jgi:calcineurin-like phosphoesterase
MLTILFLGDIVGRSGRQVVLDIARHAVMIAPAVISSDTRAMIPH